MDERDRPRQQLVVVDQNEKGGLDAVIAAAADTDACHIQPAEYPNRGCCDRDAVERVPITGTRFGRVINNIRLVSACCCTLFTLGYVTK